VIFVLFNSNLVCFSRTNYTLPPLPYKFFDLEPYIDATTMRLHHDRHHQAYTDNLNKALDQLSAKYKDFQLIESDITVILKNLEEISDTELRRIVRNNGGGYVNHYLFWEIMNSNKENTLPHPGEGNFLRAINERFGSFDSFKEKFNKLALGLFGSGWSFLYFNVTSQTLELDAFANQDTPLMQGNLPIMGLDVWEHAYYLKYQNRRIEYIQNWWYVVNWSKIEQNYFEATTKSFAEKNLTELTDNLLLNV